MEEGNTSKLNHENLMKIKAKSKGYVLKSDLAELRKKSALESWRPKSRAVVD